jgi:hypothetical protein
MTASFYTVQFSSYCQEYREKLKKVNQIINIFLFIKHKMKLGQMTAVSSVFLHKFQKEEFSVNEKVSAGSKFNLNLA